MTVDRPMIGVDLGKQRDPTALAVVEIERREGVVHYVVRFVERLPLGTAYPHVVRRLATVCRQVAQRSGQRPEVFVDGTGVGTPVVDLLDAARLDASRVWSVIFTGGDRRREDAARRRITVGKAFLVRRLQALLRDRRVHLPGCAEARALAAELQVYEIRVDVDAKARYGAFRSGTHDDLVTALALAVQREPSP